MKETSEMTDEQAPTISDIFKHENDSVDMLLKELQQEGSVKLSINNDESSGAGSPIKPLNFQAQKQPETTHTFQIPLTSFGIEQTDRDSKKDFNSSSDTYVSDHNEEVQGSSVRRDGGSILALGSSDSQHTREPVTSPSKSIMKSSTSGSPKKSVAFQQDLDTLHTYISKDPEPEMPTESATPLNHSWHEVDHSNISQDSSTMPPVPPPHTSSTITGLLDSSRDSPLNEQDNDFLEPSRIESFRNSEKGRANMSLNDKLNVFLTSSSRSNHDDLDQHLEQLGKASQEETDVNIHRLSYHLEQYKTTPESPFNALTKSSELYINSAHSSQSSLQSLMDSNRQLPADAVEKTSRGIQFNDGIKGFSDPVASSLIPMTAESDNSFSDSSSLGSHFSFSDINAQLKSEPDRSHDQSYNSTEKSILNLLNSASHTELPEQTQPKSTSSGTADSNIKREDSFEFQLDNPSAKSSPEQSPIVKAESPEPKVKAEIDSIPKLSDATDELNDPKIKTEISEEHPRVKLENELETNLPREHEEVPQIKTEKESSDKKFLNGPIKREESDQNLQIENGAAAFEEMGDEPLKKEPDHKRFSELSDYENGFNPGDSDNESFIHDGHDHSTDIQTFQVVGKAVVPGTVKLVTSADRSLNLVNSHQDKESAHQSQSVNNPDEHEADSSKDQSGDFARTKLPTEHHHYEPEQDQSISDSSNSDAYKDSVDYSLKSLAPPHEKDEQSNDLVAPASESKQVQNEIPSKTQDFDSSVLANSSNINPPLDIQLPIVETDENGFADLTERINEGSSSFEESLSAENDVEKKPFNFLSIWHSQSLSRRPEKPEKAFYKVPSISTYNTADLSQYGKYNIPPTLQPKKFTDVNVVSARVVSSTFEDLNVSAFLPELSQDSGLESHFRNLVRNSSTFDADRSAMKNTQRSRRKSFDSSNVLSELSRSGTSDTIARQPSARRRRSIHDTLKPAISAASSPADPVNSFPKKSKFRVPSFEIKRSSSILSPKNQYDDIFADGSFVEPTIRASGMKTLPSMDRDDVKKIMQMKQAMSLEEYSGLKNVGASTVSATQQEPKGKYEGLQQHASIYCDSLLSNSASVAANFHADNDGSRSGVPNSQLPQGRSNQNAKISFRDSHVYGSLSEKPIAICRPEDAEKKTHVSPIEATPRDSTDNEFPEPNLNIVAIPKTPQDEDTQEFDQAEPRRPSPVRKISANNPFREFMQESQLTDEAPNREQEDKGDSSSAKGHTVQNSDELTPEQVLVSTPDHRKNKSARNSPIKINSPVKVVRHNGSVTGIVLDKKPSDHNDMQELHNKKLRTDKTHLSTVSVPSNVMSEWSTNTRLESGKPSEVMDGMVVKPKDSRKVSKGQDKGKLFFRVVGLKNVAASEIKDRNVAFNLTLDNGVHCIKTPNYQLDAKRVSIDKEFELSVSESLEFILTLKASYSKVKPGYKEVKERTVVKSKNKIGRLFGSKDIVTTTKFVPQEVEDPLERVFATDGSFARCYVDFDQYKSQITGQACNYNLACFNEWASYTHNGQKVVKKAYHIGQLEVKMLYVPRSEDYEILPTSIKSAYESLDDLKSERSLSLEGYLHQDGGDCETRKRRWFKLSGTSLIAHSEFSHKTRAKINLAKVVEVIYVDKENLGQSSLNYRNFSDIMLMENSFKIKFANGEIIDFGAPSKTEKLLWIKTIQEIVCRNKFRRQPWVKLMQAKYGDRRKSWSEA